MVIDIKKDLWLIIKNNLNALAKKQNLTMSAIVNGAGDKQVRFMYNLFLRCEDGRANKQTKGNGKQRKAI